MHYIQKHILDELRTAESVRYAKLNPDEIESGHFRYHLQQLIRDGYVAQESRGLYGLTLAGQHFVDTLSAHRVNALPMPKVITYTLLRKNNAVILYRKTKQPYKDLLNMIGGKLHEGETSEHAALREVAEKTGQTIDTPTLAGVFEVLIKKQDVLLTHVIAYVYTLEIAALDLDSELLVTLPIDALSDTSDLAPDFLPIFREITDSATKVKLVELHL